MNKITVMTCVGAAAMMIAADVTVAQTASKDEPKNQPAATPMPMPMTSPKRVRAVRKSMVDLEALAKDRRPGQVMPGDPSPMGGVATKVPMGDAATPVGSFMSTDKPVTAASLEQNANKPQIKLPNTAPYNKPVLKPVGDNAARPEVLNGTMPVPEPEQVVETKMVGNVTTAAPAPVVATAVAAAPVVERVVPVVEVPAAVEHAAPVAAVPVVERVEPKVAEKMIERAPVAAAPVNAAAPVAVAVAAPVPASALVDGVVMMQVPSALSTGGASVRVESIAGDAAGVQWRIGNGAWTTPTVGETAEGKIEVRAGLDGQVVLVVDGLAELRVTRLGRATIERCTESRGATSVGLGVTRGAVEVRPVGAALQDAGKGQMFARVRTPDQVFGLVGPLRVEYDAFSGTKRRGVNQ